jgi:hypothetical protein
MVEQGKDHVLSTTDADPFLLPFLLTGEGGVPTAAV